MRALSRVLRRIVGLAHEVGERRIGGGAARGDARDGLVGDIGIGKLAGAEDLGVERAIAVGSDRRRR